MRTAHPELGATKTDLNALVENLQQAMREADGPLDVKNKLLSKLVPMSKDVNER